MEYLGQRVTQEDHQLVGQRVNLEPLAHLDETEKTAFQVADLFLCLK